VNFCLQFLLRRVLLLRVLQLRYRSAFFFTLHHSALHSDVEVKRARNGYRLFDQSGLAVAGSSVL
jgi:hypothetical protein